MLRRGLWGWWGWGVNGGGLWRWLRGQRRGRGGGCRAPVRGFGGHGRGDWRRHGVWRLRRLFVWRRLWSAWWCGYRGTGRGLGRERGGSASGRDGLQPCHAVRACAADRVQHACGVAAWSPVCGLLFGALMPCICRADLAVPLRDSACVSLLPNPFLSFLFVNLLPAGTAATGFGASAASTPAFGATAGADARAQARNRTRTRARTRTDTIHEPRE